MLSGSRISSKESQCQKASFPTWMIPSGKETSVREVQPAKVALLIRLIPLGMFISFNDVQPINAPLWISSRSSGSVTDFSDVWLQNAWDSIILTDAGTTILSFFLKQNINLVLSELYTTPSLIEIYGEWFSISPISTDLQSTGAAVMNPGIS